MKINTDYEELLAKVLLTGTKKEDRTGTGTMSIFGAQMRFDLSKGFPLITTKKVFTKAVIHELLWLLNGDTNIKYLTDNGVHIWDEWADENGDLGPVYGQQWRSWKAPVEYGELTVIETVDQIAKVVNSIKENPDSRRHIVSAWNPADVDDMALPPCHTMFQFYVANGKLSCHLYQRSGDLFLGVPFNIASYSLLTHMVAQQTGLEVGEFVHTIGDAHIYLNHETQVKIQLGREVYEFPQLELNKADDIFSYTYEDFKINNYRHHAALKGKVAV